MDLSFLEKNKQQLIQIYIKERINNRGENGALFVDFSKNQNADVYYLPISGLNDSLREELMAKEKFGRNNIVYFYLFDNVNSSLLEIEL